ncbi:hypothetical protein N7486_000056 [Penicillium sp. IBT 16267x]|nr:hypothetical protein N7486_000056 [Penicillium sp. IBT 16267x]
MGSESLQIQLPWVYVPSTGITIAVPLVYGGICQVVAGMWEMASGNTFGATSFSSFGAYWITIGVMSIIKDTTENGDTCQAETLMGVFMMVCAVAPITVIEIDRHA